MIWQADRLQGLLDAQPGLTAAIGLAALLAAAIASYFVARWLLVGITGRAVRRTRVRWDDALVDERVPQYAALAVPALVAVAGVRYVPYVPDAVADLVTRAGWVLLAFAVGLALHKLLAASQTIYEMRPYAGEYSIAAYVQLGQLLVWLGAALIVVSVILDKPPFVLLGGLGAITAVLLLVFRNTILGFVAGVQLVSNDMLRVGDWIEMPQAGADGDVIDIRLHTVKVQNWDKTITAIPSHKFLEEPFQNWRGMSETGGRRIKRSIFIDVDSVRFLDEKEVERFGRVALIADYMAGKRRKLDSVNRSRADTARGRDDVSNDEPLETNQLRLTNLGTYRAYVLAYLDSRADIRDDLTKLVRQLDPTPNGLPLEVYAFTATTEWNAYESIQADIFDHLLAVAGEFDLRLYQRPGGEQLVAALEAGGQA